MQLHGGLVDEVAVRDACLLTCSRQGMAAVRGLNAERSAFLPSFHDLSGL